MFKSNQKGFTLLELLVTIFVIAIGLIAAYVVAQYPLSRVSVSMSTLKAAYLAQEGIEIVRNIRDTNWLEEDNWKTDLDICDPSSKYCEADYDDLGLISYSKSSDQPNLLKFNGDFYNYDSGSNTKFRRTIEIKEDGDKLKVTVTVSWEEKGKSYDFDLQENLYDYWGS